MSFLDRLYQPRHLLLISRGDVAVDVVRRQLQQTTPLSVLWGSPWQDDQSDAYKYRCVRARDGFCGSRSIFCASLAAQHLRLLCLMVVCCVHGRYMVLGFFAVRVCALLLCFTHTAPWIHMYVLSVSVTELSCCWNMAGWIKALISPPSLPRHT